MEAVSEQASGTRRLARYLPQLAGFLLAAYCALLASLSVLRIEHVLLALIVNGLAWIGPRSRQVLTTLAGFVGVAWMYDAMRFVKQVGLSPERVLLCDLYEFERRWFGFEWAGQRITVHDWFLTHHHLAADIVFSFPYATFIFFTVAYAVYLFIVDRPGAARFGWAFFLLNLVGYVTYHVVPAAPPWYFHANGCVVDLAAHASAIPYFAGFYGRSTDVFGAIPSLHVAYPLMLVWESFRRHGKWMRGLTLTYWLWMSAAAVYLNHHWFTDVWLGWIYALGALTLVYLVAPRQARTEAPAGD
jgi:hypothetical protein